MPEDVEQSALEVNTVDATEAQKTQAAQEIDNDPTIPAPDPAAEPEPEPEPGHYDGLKLDELRAALKKRELPTSGNKDELIERLNQADDAAKSPGDEPEQPVNGGIAVNHAAVDAHAATLQELSDARRASQLKATQG